MGSAVTKQPENRNNMEGNPRAKSVAPSDKKLKNKHGSQQMSTKASQENLQVKEKDNIILKGARATEEEPRRPDNDLDGAHGTYNSRSVRITNFDYGDISKLEGYFQRNYSSGFKQVKEDGLGFIVEFKSIQVSESVVKGVHKVDGITLEITFDSTPMVKGCDTATKVKGKKQDVTAIDDGAEEEGQLYPFDQMHQVKRASQEGNLLSKDRSSHDAESHNNGHLSMYANEQRNKAMVHGMPDNVGDEDDKMGEDLHQAKVRNELPNISAREFRTVESVDEITIEVDAVKVEFIKKVHRIEYDEIGHSNNVIIEHDTESQPGMVTFRTNGPRRGNAESAYEQFMELYHRISATLSRNNTVNVLKVLPDCTIRSLNRALTLANANDRVLVKNCLSDDFNVVFYGSEVNVANAIANFIENSEKQEDGHGYEGNPRPQSHITHMRTMDTQVYAHVLTHDVKNFEGTVGDITIRVYEGDLTQEKVDVVVNAANERLDHAGGVALAISRAGGKMVQRESSEYVRKHGTLPIGQAMHTGAGKMPCKYVIHTVGPKWKDHADKETVQSQLYEALFNVLHYAANRLKARSIAIPAISAGIYGVPVDICAEQLVLATQTFVQSPPANNTLRDIRFVNIDGQINRAFVRVFSGSFPSNDSGAHYYEAIGDEDCPICMDKVVQPKRLGCCSNVFCTDCIDKAFQVKPVCPICGYQSGVLKGTQPKTATMTFAKTSRVLPGYEECGSIQIYYDIPSGIQEDCHPNPGRPYKGSMRMAFLPDNTEGQKVLQLLKKAFDRRLVFTIGTSVTTGKTDAVIWNDIHHKTSPYGGPSNYGYPDRGYLRRVTDELAAKGIK